MTLKTNKKSRSANFDFGLVGEITEKDISEQYSRSEELFIDVIAIN